MYRYLHKLSARSLNGGGTAGAFRALSQPGSRMRPTPLGGLVLWRWALKREASVSRVKVLNWRSRDTIKKRAGKGRQSRC